MKPPYGGLREIKSKPTLLKMHVLCLKFRTQVVQVYLQPFRRNSLLKCALQPKIAKNSLKPAILGVQGRSRSSTLINLKSPSSALVMISSTSVPICNRFHATRAISSKITTFRGYPSLTPGCAGLLELTGLGLGLLKFTFNAEKFIRRLSWSISSRFVTVHC